MWNSRNLGYAGFPLPGACAAKSEQSTEEIDWDNVIQKLQSEGFASCFSATNKYDWGEVARAAVSSEQEHHLPPFSCSVPPPPGFPAPRSHLSKEFQLLWNNTSSVAQAAEPRQLFSGVLEKDLHTSAPPPQSRLHTLYKVPETMPVLPSTATATTTTALSGDENEDKENCNSSNTPNKWATPILLCKKLASASETRPKPPPPPPVAAAAAPSLVFKGAFFGDANNDASTIVLNLPQDEQHTGAATCTTRAKVMKHLAELKRTANYGFGIVPIANSFTTESSSTKAVNVKSYRSAASMPTIAPPRTSFSPSGDELKNLILYQLGMPSGRQGLFQGVLYAQETGESAESLLGCFVFVDQDDGVELGVLRAYEHLSEPVPGISEVPFMRILKRADKKDLAQLTKKFEEERKILALMRTPKITALSPTLDVVYCEFQFDRKKLISFACLPDFADFRDYVSAVHGLCASNFGYGVRIFIQRKFPPEVAINKQNPRWRLKH